MTKESPTRAVPTQLQRTHARTPALYRTSANRLTLHFALTSLRLIGDVITCD